MASVGVRIVGVPVMIEMVVMVRVTVGVPRGAEMMGTMLDDNDSWTREDLQEPQAPSNVP